MDTNKDGNPVHPSIPTDVDMQDIDDTYLDGRDTSMSHDGAVAEPHDTAMSDQAAKIETASGVAKEQSAIKKDDEKDVDSDADDAMTGIQKANFVDTNGPAATPPSQTISYASAMDDLDEFNVVDPQKGSPASSNGDEPRLDKKASGHSNVRGDTGGQSIFTSSQQYGSGSHPGIAMPTSPTPAQLHAASTSAANESSKPGLFTDVLNPVHSSTLPFPGAQLADASMCHPSSMQNIADGNTYDDRSNDPIDLLPRTKGMFRLLDLYSEPSNSGLVDKIVIAQESLRAFIDTLHPGAYKSLTKIDFAALDNILIKPVGVYGSKSEIVRFLFDAGAIDDDLARLLSIPEDPSCQTQARLRSGIYVLIRPVSTQVYFDPSDSALYVVYWPEDTTWDDFAIGSVRKNRVTFIRYLTRLADQIRVLISPEHASSLAWKDVARDEDEDAFGFDISPGDDSADDDNSACDDRFFKFEVAKTNEQEEDVQVSRGFAVQHSDIAAAEIQTVLPGGAPRPVHVNAQFVLGETCQGFVSARPIQASVKTRWIEGTRYEPALKSELAKYPTIILADSVDDEGLHVLLDKGDLKSRIPELYLEFKQTSKDNEIRRVLDEKAIFEKVMGEIKENAPRLKHQIRIYLAYQALDLYQMLDTESLIQKFTEGVERGAEQNKTTDSLDYFHHVCTTYPEAEKARKGIMDQLQDLKYLKHIEYAALRRRFLNVQAIIAEKEDLTDAQRKKLIENILSDSDITTIPPATSNQWGVLKLARSVLSRLGLVAETAGTPFAYSRYASVQLNKDDPKFLASLNDITVQEPMYADPVARLRELAFSALGQGLKKAADNLAAKMKLAQEHGCPSRAKRTATARYSQQTKDAAVRFRRRVKEVLQRPSASPPLNVTSVETGQYRGVHITAFYDETSEPRVERRIWTLELTEDDKQRMKEDPSWTPSPRVSRQPETTFSFSPDWVVRHVQLLGQKKCLIIADTPSGVSIWLFPVHSGLSLNRPTRNFPSVPGRRYTVAVDEQKRVIAFVLMESSRCTVQLYAMDEIFSNVRSRGSPFSLMEWYQDGEPDIVAATFFSGSEELCLVESSGRIRVFSFLSQLFRPATIQLPNRPLHVQSSPDGSALIIIEGTPGEGKTLRVFHQASFGVKNSGIQNDLPTDFNNATDFSVTSLGQRGKVFVTALVPSSHSIVSASVVISKKETEYQFRLKDDSSKSSPIVPTQHNALLDCFSDVWSRYPVVAAIQREHISSQSRLQTSVTFVCETPDYPFNAYFKRMIRDFERLSRKPTNQRLDQIAISAAQFDDLEWELTSSSRYKSGEWLVELLCLLPIHIAVARENRFIPLKNGIFNPAMEQELLGADVSQIINSISLGWYESIFSSYMASKPVKVISSMGEQSVGKSYSLNHIVDSSFAGSAVRTTEGVWLSVCPTKDLLVVALDFEGVHSIERTRQEDMLLVLFNTALSNLVLFRNNFALSRDVANMFTSFQASTHLFDPASNPKLFKGLLAIVIKDVVERDKKEIVKEFSSKFHQIVSNEQGNNFISVLHDSQLTVIPWSVIQSREFYTMFTKLSKLLYQQRTTHKSGGEFLITLKTLMAKMKAQDWGSIDQTAIKHRSALLMALLPSAFASGRGDEGLGAEDLENLDNQAPIPHSDGPAIFYLQKDSSQCQSALASHVAAWDGGAGGYDLDGLRAYLRDIADSRVQHVRDWLDANTSRFPAENADIRALKRVFGDGSEALRSNLQLCLAECTTCRLSCILHKSHDQSDHDCGTSHQCLHPCDFSEEHYEVENCGLPAGHAGRHICDGAAHVCGQPCRLQQKKGCQKLCTGTIDHVDGEHLCSARMHQCGEPCGVRDMATASGQLYSCNDLCSLPHDEEHSRHSCENRLSCPIKCQLCQRYCVLGDHFHGFDSGARHLCGQGHACSHDCEAQGICEINTTPHSVETTFTGRHDTFQYTKYTQVATRLACAVVILPGEFEHLGPHTHSTAADVVTFHYCEESCINCGYICTLPLGHTQIEHDTAHGSMEQTAWAIEGSVDATVEIQGRTFGAQDGGAPQLCSAVCRDLGRHAHIDYCRNARGATTCQEPQSEHIHTAMLPNANRPKDWVSHKVFWARTGFRDPYSRDEQEEFSLCDVQCAGPEHQATGTAPVHPSFCTLPIFHPPQPISWQVDDNMSYVSTDGHDFACPNPNSLRQAYHVIFVLDRSSSMGSGDRRPVPNQPVTPLISRSHNNRFGAVLSALYGFWVSRASGTNAGRRDSYSVITFNASAQARVTNDFTSTPDELLAQLVQIHLGWGTHFNAALISAQALIEDNWSTDRSPVVVFLSDGECNVSDNVIFDLCNRAVARGKPLSLHSVSFGRAARSASLRRMVTVADQVAQAAPRDPLSPLVPSTYAEVLDSIRLSETFLGIADSLKKPRASLIRS